MKRFWLAIVVGLALLVPSATLAVSGAAAETVTLKKGDNRTGSYYAAGTTVTIDGDVDGDVGCVGQTVVINGAVKGDVLCAGQTVTVNGPVSGSVRVAGQFVIVNGAVGRNLSVAGQHVTIDKSTHVSGEAAIAGQNVIINGPIDRDVVVAASETMTLGATIGGDFGYLSQSTFAVDKALVKGKVTHQMPPQEHKETIQDRLGSLFFWLVGSLLIIVTLIWLMPQFVRAITSTMLSRPGASIGWGTLVLVGGPILLFIIAASIFGLPLMALGLGAWLTVLLTANLFAGVAVGLLVLGRKDTSISRLMLAALAGVSLVVIASWIPVIGFIVGLGSAVWTLGGVSLALVQVRDAGEPRTPAKAKSEPAQVA